MDTVRLGLAIRALRRRRGWTQGELATRAGVSTSSISRIERGAAASFALRTLIAVSNALGASLQLRLLWQGEELDRLLDRGHAQLVDAFLRILSAAGWVAEAEVTFNISGERGSVDILARHPVTGHILVVEVKTVVPDVQGLLSSLDRKARLAPRLARDRGWPAGPVARVLVLPDDRTARRRIAALDQIFATAMGARTREVQRWLRSPVGQLAGLVFLTGVNPVQARHRVGHRSGTDPARARASAGGAAAGR